MTDWDLRVMAVDWSGNKNTADAKKHIWLAEAHDNQVCQLAPGKGREELIDHLIELGRNSPNIVVGLDFAFSAPKWFVTKHGVERGPDFWHVVADEGEGWLESCPWPFWGRRGTRRPQDVVLFRATEAEAARSTGVYPKSVFQIAGAGAVGTGSIRGMPYLLSLLQAGWHVWPFTKPGFPMAVEIYPRLLIGALIKKDPRALAEFLSARFPQLDESMRKLAVSDDSAFDAAVSALVMAKHRDELLALPAPDETDLLEGRIWSPSYLGY